MTIYFIPRKFDLLIENLNYFTSFETLSGFVKCKSQAAYEQVGWQDWCKKMHESVSLEAKAFSDLKDSIIKKFLAEYDGEIIPE